MSAISKRRRVESFPNRTPVRWRQSDVSGRELARPAWRNEHVAIGTATDPYQAIEARYRITRGIIVELARASTPAHLITRSPLIVRDVDVLSELARAAEFGVCVSLPTLDAALARRIEPTVAPPRQRLRAVERLAAAGIRVSVAIAPVLPHLTDDPAAIAAVVQAAADAGASRVWSSVLNLGDVARESYFAFLETEQPQLVAAYRELYRTRYAPAAYDRAVGRDVDAARATTRFAPPPAIEPRPARELSLFRS